MSHYYCSEHGDDPDSRFITCDAALEWKQKDATIATMQARIDALTAALKSIANPIAYLQQEAEREGYRINGGAAVSLASDAEFLKGLAKTALLEAEK